MRLSGAWQQLRVLNERTEPFVSTKPRALFVLDAVNAGLEPALRFDVQCLEDCCRSLQWEVGGSASLGDIPSTLLRQVDEYELVVIFVASTAIATKHAVLLKHLSPEFPFLIVFNEPCAGEQVRTQCAALGAVAAPSSVAVGPLVVTSVASWSGAANEFCVKSMVEKSCDGALGLTLSHPDKGTARTPWFDERSLRPTRHCTDVHQVSVVVSVDTDEVVDGKYVGGLLKHVLPNSRVRWTEKRGMVCARTTSISDIEDVAARMRSVLGATVSAEGPLLLVSEPLSGGDASEACARLRALGIAGVETFSPAYRLEVSTHLAIAVALELARREGLIDDEVGLRVETLTVLTETKSPVPAKSVMVYGEQQQQQKQLASGATVTRGNPLPLPTVGSSTQQAATNSASSTATVLAASEDTTQRAATESNRGFSLPSRDALQEMISAMVSSSVGTLREENAALRREVGEMHEELEAIRRREHTLAQTVDALQSDFAPMRQAVQSVQQVQGAILQLHDELQRIKASAADHQLVESAINDLKSRCATVDTVREAEGRLAAASRSIQQGSEALRVSVEGVKGHLEALALQHQHLVSRVEAQRSTVEHQRQTATGLQSLDSRVHEVEQSHRMLRDEVLLLQEACELGINKLFTEVKTVYQHGRRTEDTVVSHSSRLDDLQTHQAAIDSSIQRAVDEALTVGSERRMSSLLDQLASTKAYCSAAVERNAELQSQRVDSLEARLSRDVQAAVEQARRQQSVEVQRVQDVVEQHIRSQKKLLEDISIASPAKTSGSPTKHELQLLREQIERTFREQELVRDRVKGLELVQQEVSGILGDEDKRMETLQELARRVEDLEASVVFIESRL